MTRFLCSLLVVFTFYNAASQQQPYFQGNHQKNYVRDCQPCQDPWVGEVFYNVWGTCPATLGGTAEGYCNILLWNGGRWKDKKELEWAITQKFVQPRSSGQAYVFIKPQNVVGLGHIGWGFQLTDGSYYAGSTEANTKGIVRTYIRLAGQDNDFWGEMFLGEAQMLTKMKNLGYSAYKRVTVKNPSISSAKARAQRTMMAGFQGISNNCLDHTYLILEGYGVKDMPWKQTNPTPNGWFNAFYNSTTGGGYTL
jgi:hypothetical protein